MKEPTIEISEITKDYQLGKTTVKALRGINFSFQPAMSYAIIGPSGAGKSSLLHILGCLDKPTSGEYSINGVRVSGLTESKLTHIRAKEIGFIFQNFQLNPILTALDNVAIALRISGVKMKEAKTTAIEMLERVGLGNHTKHYPNELSGGQRQRVAIARALVKKPSLLLADEPTGNLDSVTSDEIVKLLIALPHEARTTLIVVTHNHEIAKQCKQIISLKDGLIIN